MNPLKEDLDVAGLKAQVLKRVEILYEQERRTTRAPTLHHRIHLRAIRGFAARASDEPSTWFSPDPHFRQAVLRKAGAGPSLQLCLMGDSQPTLLDYYPAPP